MSKSANCQELQLSKAQSPQKCYDASAITNDRFKPRLQERQPEETSKNVSYRKQQCVPNCPDSAIDNVDGLDEKKCKNQYSDNVDGTNVNDVCEPEDLVDGHLGPIPRTSEGSVPTEYWAPLADLTKSRPAVANQSANRYSPAEWLLHDYRRSAQFRKIVEKELSVTSFEAERCMNRVYAQTDKDQQDNNVKLNARLKILRRWKLELQRELDKFGNEINAIQEERKRLTRCIHALTLVESINRDVKRARCLRMESELVRDDVDDELSNELDMCADIRNVYVRCSDQLKMQLQELKDAKRRLEMDLTDKEEAWKLDVACRALYNNSSTLKWQPGAVQISAAQSTPTSYEDYCKEALAMSWECLERSNILRKNLGDIYEKSVRDLRTQADRVTITLTRKIDELTEICIRLERELGQCLKALSNAENLLEATRKGTKRLDGAMKCAQTRLDLRSQRNKVENCRDLPQFGLIDEVKNLSEGASAMLSQIKNASSEIDDLTKTRRTTETNIAAKRKSLSIDRDQCQLLRSFYPTIQVLAGY